MDFGKLVGEFEFPTGTIKQIALKAAFEAANSNSEITWELLRELCEFELGNNMVGFKRKTNPIGFGK